MQSFPDPVFNVTHFADVGPLWIQGMYVFFYLEILLQPSLKIRTAKKHLLDLSWPKKYFL